MVMAFLFLIRIPQLEQNMKGNGKMDLNKELELNSIEIKEMFILGVLSMDYQMEKESMYGILGLFTRVSSKTD